MKFIKFLLITWSLSVNAGLPPLPSVSGQSGKFLTNDGSKMSWGSASGTIVAAPGTVLTLAAATCPTGTLLADGSAISRTTYSDLFASIGTAHGSGDGSTTFNLPDYRGRFLRGVDGGVARDPDRASRTSMNTGGNTGDAVGSVQSYEVQSHNHQQQGLTQPYGSPIAATRGTIQGTGLNANYTPITNAAVSNTGSVVPLTTVSAGGNETRPINANVIYCVVTTSLATATSSYTPGYQVFTSNGTFVVPSGVTKILVSGCGGGGAGGSWQGGGGGAAFCIVNRSYAVTAGSSHAVTIGAGGIGNTSTSAGPTGGTTSLGALVSLSGGGGGAAGQAAGSTGCAGSTPLLKELLSTNGSNSANANTASCAIGNGSGGFTIYGSGGSGATVGAGGTAAANTGAGGGGSGNSTAGGSGGSGILIIQW